MLFQYVNGLILLFLFHICDHPSKSLHNSFNFQISFYCLSRCYLQCPRNGLPKVQSVMAGSLEFSYENRNNKEIDLYSDYIEISI